MFVKLFMYLKTRKDEKTNLFIHNPDPDPVRRHSGANGAMRVAGTAYNARRAAQLVGRDANAANTYVLRR
jgi:hypothetical protein